MPVQPNTGMMRERPNLILHRLAKAIPCQIGNCFLEQKYLVLLVLLRPDIYIINKDCGEAIIVDVTTPFETSSEAFDKARSEKIDKCTPLIYWLKSQDCVSCVSLHAFIVGSLGSIE